MTQHLANVDVTVIELEKGEEGSEVEWGRESEGRGKAERWGERGDTPPHPLPAYIRIGGRAYIGAAAYIG